MTELRIRFAAVLSSDAALVPRIRNFAEDLQRSLSHASIGMVENMDSAVDTVLVRVASTRMMGDASEAARSALERHNLVADAVLEH
jgi:hypothetical protein